MTSYLMCKKMATWEKSTAFKLAELLLHNVAVYQFIS